MKNDSPGQRYSRAERSEADWRAGLEIAEREQALKAAKSKLNQPAPVWLNAMGADDVIKNRRLVEMPLTNEEREDMCRRASRIVE